MEPNRIGCTKASGLEMITHNIWWLSSMGRRTSITTQLRTARLLVVQRGGLTNLRDVVEGSVGTSAKGCPVVGLNRVAVWDMLTSWSTRKAVVDTYRRILRPRHPPQQNPPSLSIWAAPSRSESRLQGLCQQCIRPYSLRAGYAVRRTSSQDQLVARSIRLRIL